eukprot:COSAG01_NODE_6455_length_3657_cov_2.617416_1_plen_294_part_10
METGCCLPSRPEIVQQPAKIGLLEQALAINLRSHSISTFNCYDRRIDKLNHYDRRMHCARIISTATTAVPYGRTHAQYYHSAAAASAAVTTVVILSQFCVVARNKSTHTHTPLASHRQPQILQATCCGPAAAQQGSTAPPLYSSSCLTRARPPRPASHYLTIITVHNSTYLSPPPPPPPPPMSSMMELMFPSAPPQSGADRSHYGGALESTACYQHGDQTALNRGQGHVGRTLQAGNKDRAIKLPSPVSLTISVKKLGQRVAMKDESRNRCGTIHSVPVVCMLRHAISAYARNV